MQKLHRLYFICLAVGLSFSFMAQKPLQASNKSSAIPIYNSPENLRSDTFNILKYTINLEIGNSSTQNILGNTQIRFAPKLNNRTFIRFDLLKLTIDSVKENSSSVSYVYNDTILKINFASPKNTVDTSVITVYYKGIPQIDATGWGGFYFDNTQAAQYAFNLGVGFGAKPHNYGRVWYPCFDNFVERSKYEFNITTDTLRRAHCNGQFMSDVVSANKRTRKWILNEEIPTYLVCVAAANYTQVNWTVNTLNGVKPISLVAVASDTSAMKAGFVNLKNCIAGFEHYFGPYQWNKFGYYLVPFNGGAMEHATNIAYPRFAIGNLANEYLMAHELSHHWWGNLITCETQEDMWINEGMATFSAYMFTEWQYGKAKALNDIKTEHDQLLHFLHKNESGFRAVSGVPHSLTYGDHVYKKGADVAHTLRGYMGDTAFFAGAKYTLQQKSFNSINSNEFRDLLQTSCGQNLNDFFNNWIFAGGWSHFSIDSVNYVQLSSNNYQAVVSIKQKLFGAPALHTNVPLELSFFKADWTRVTRKITMSGAHATFTVSVPYSAIYYGLNYDSKINDATSHEVKVIKTVSNVTYNLGKLFVKVQNKGADSSLLRVIHNYVKPDDLKSNPFQHKLSDQHYWKIEGILSNGFEAKVRFNYDGTKVNGGNFSYLDTLLTSVNADSIHVFYRKNAKAHWQLVQPSLRFSSGAKTGFIEIDTLKLGEYTFGNMGDTTSVGWKENTIQKIELNVYPNPSKQNCSIEFKENLNMDCDLMLYTIEGKLVNKKTLNARVSQLELTDLSKGTYILKLEQKGNPLHSQKLIIE
jgi:aminopeptidase N